VLSNEIANSDKINNIIIVKEDSIIDINEGTNYMLNNERENINVYIIRLDDLYAQLKIIDNRSGILVELFARSGLSLIFKNKDQDLLRKFVYLYLKIYVGTM